MKTIEDELGRAPETLQVQFEYDGCWLEYGRLIREAVIGWESRQERVLMHDIEDQFFKKHGEWPYVRSEWGHDVSKLSYFMNVVLKYDEYEMDSTSLKCILDERKRLEEIREDDQKQMEDVDKKSIGMDNAIKLNDQRLALVAKVEGLIADELEAHVKTVFSESLLAEAAEVRVQMKEQIKQKHITIANLEGACLAIFKRFTKEGQIYAQGMTCMYEPRGLSMTHDFGRGVGCDLSKESELMPLLFKEKVRLLSVATPSIYMQWMGDGFDQTVRVSDYRYIEPTPGLLVGRRAPVDMELIFDANGEIDKESMDYVVKTIKDAKGSATKSKKTEPMEMLI